MTPLSQCLLTFGEVQSTFSLSNNTRNLESNIEAPFFPARPLYPLTAQCHSVVEVLKKMRQHTFKTSPYPHTAYILLLNPSYGRSTFIVAEGSLLRASGPSVIQYYLVFLMVFGIEKYFDGMRYLHISPHNSGYGCDTSMYPNLLYHMIRDMISPSIPIYNAISHRITQKPKARTTSTKTDYLVAVHVLLWLLVSALFLPCLPPGLFCRPSVAHQMDTS